MSHIRSKIGHLKFLLIDHWPYILHRRRAQAAEIRLMPFLSSLPIPSPAASLDLDIHTLTGRKHFHMALWSIWSILRFLPGARFFLHSDGTLTSEDFRPFSYLFPTLTFISKSERDSIIAARLAKSFPALLRWRGRHIFGAKLIDFHFYGHANHLLLLDSDVLCFKSPTEISDLLGQPGSHFRWHEDFGSSYPAPIQDLRSILGGYIPEHVNAGFLLCKRWSKEDLAFLDHALSKLTSTPIDPMHFWMEQALYAISACRHTTYSPLPSSYSLRYGRTPSDVVIRHYVGVLKIRPRFFLEGVPILLRQVVT